MESGFPAVNCLLQYTLRSLCSCSSDYTSSSSSKWVYAVFWRILPRNYPPPEWDHCGTALDRAKRNWILVWEDGFCDFLECEREGSGYMTGKFGAHVFFKLAHEVYSYGEGVLGKVAADRSHKWVFSESTTNETDPNVISSRNMANEPQPRAWESQFNSGIQTIAIISVREGIIQLGSFDKIVEDLQLVVSIQRRFSCLPSIPRTLATQRSYQHPYTLKAVAKKRQTIGMKRVLDPRMDDDHFPIIKSINLGWNNPKYGGGGGGGGGDGPEQFFFSIPPLLPTMSCSFRALLSKVHHSPHYHSGRDTLAANSYSYTNGKCNNRVKFEDDGGESGTGATKDES